MGKTIQAGKVEALKRENDPVQQEVIRVLEELQDVDLIHLGLTGSRAYGVAREDSDVDLRGVYVADKSVFGGLPMVAPEKSIETGEDTVVFELSRFGELAYRGNPNIMEMLFSEERIDDPRWSEIRDNRSLFVTKKLVIPYLGFASSAIKRAERTVARGGDPSKGIRTVFRLMEQLEDFLVSGETNIKVKNPEHLFELGSLPLPQAIEAFNQKASEIKEIRSPLPDEPDLNQVHQLIRGIRGL